MIKKKELSKNFFHVGKKYSITLNPIDKHQFINKGYDRFKSFRSFVYEQCLATKYEYELFIEISEPYAMKTQGYFGPRLHMHGYVKFRSSKELAQFLMYDYYKLLRWTSVDIDTIGDESKWYSYCTKQHLFKNNRLSNFTRPKVDITKKLGGPAKRGAA